MGRGLCKRLGEGRGGRSLETAQVLVERRGAGGQPQGASFHFLVHSVRGNLGSGPGFYFDGYLKKYRCTLDQRSQTQRLNTVCTVGIPTGRPVTSIQRDGPDLSHAGNIINLETVLFTL